jgi:sugar lactone lactonase YvrE
MLLSAGVAAAAGTQTRTYKTQRDFEQGKPDGVSIGSYGQISLAPRIDESLNLEVPFVWSGICDSKGRIYVSGGSGGQVFRIDKNGTSKEIYNSEDQQIYAMVVDNKDNLYIASSPEGQVIRFSADDTGEVVFENEQTYIWDLIFSDNNLYIATGDKGNIYKLDNQANVSLFYESEDDHIRSLALDKQGNLIAGTADEALIIRITPAGEAFVLYDAPLVEITDIAVAGSGAIYAAASGDTYIPVTRRAAETAGADNEDSGDDEENELDVDMPPTPARTSSRSRQQNGILYRINTNSVAKAFWIAPRSRIYSVMPDKEYYLLVGTGDNGRFYAVDAAGEYSLLNQFDEQQVTALCRNRAGDIYIGTSNSGRVYHMKAGLKPSGEYLSNVIDSRIISNWGALNWELDDASAGQVVFQTRSGNTGDPDKSWSKWSDEYTGQGSAAITSPPARFLQFKARLSVEQNQSPRLNEISLSYLQKNIAPDIDDIIIHPEGDYYPDFRNYLNSDSHADTGENGQNGYQSQSMGRKSQKPGFRSVSWRSGDDNGDQLVYDMYYRGENAKGWKTLFSDFSGPVYSWDSQLLPDGRYFLKLVASDKMSNPPNMVKTAEKISQPFIVDNSGPVVRDIRIVKRQGRDLLSFVVEDALQSIQNVEYGLNADSWQLVYPVDGICDSKIESFEVEIGNTIKGTNTIVVKARDATGNIGFGKSNAEL